MPRLYLFAEGQTERAFAATVLRPHLVNFKLTTDRTRPRASELSLNFRITKTRSLL